ncbi:MAG: hypothetical protein JJU29_18610 [Verrucomicrobia bacterium]|nr:hypothetical protein [Verrucomicrobiota bacterium]MCH8513981.1 hypothetical protein [Kiritimatiellia bacterium]
MLPFPLFCRRFASTFPLFFKQSQLFRGLLLICALSATNLHAEPTALWPEQADWRVAWTLSQVMGGRDGNYEPFDRGWARPNTPTPENWMAADFDDSQWGFASEFSPGIGEDGVWQLSTISLRRHFAVSNPDEVSGLVLNVSYRGGIVVYVNGREVSRHHLPDGELGADTLAEDYPLSAFVHPETGTPLPRQQPPDATEDMKAGYQSRIREARVPIPNDVLREGANVVAIGIHRAPYHVAPLEEDFHRYHLTVWSTAGFLEAQLHADSPSGVYAHEQIPGPYLWVPSMLTGIGRYATDGDPFSGPRPLTLQAPRNGVVSGSVVAENLSGDEELAATISPFTHESGARLPSEAVRIRYALHDSENRAHPYDVLSPAPPRGPQRLPVWLTVHIPADTEPGLYEAELNITGANRNLTSKVRLRVHEWTSPPPREFRAWSGLFQSPETLSETYEVSFGSNEHFGLIEQSLRYAGKTGNKVAAISAQRDTSFLGREALLVFQKNGRGELVPDLRLVERYLRLIDEHVGEPKALIVNLWTVANDPRRDRPDTLPVSLITSEGIVAHDIPNFGNPGSEEIWRPALGALRELVEKLGWDPACLMLGMPSDDRPSQETHEFLARVAPEMTWATYSHHAGPRPRGLDIYPARHGRGPYGWKVSDPYLMTNHRGSLVEYSALIRYRTLAIRAMREGFNGVSGIAIDFWPIPGEDRDTNWRFANPPRGWGRIFRNGPRTLLAPGPDGPLATTRFEMYREGFQETEAYIYIQENKDDPLLPPELAARAKAIQERVDRKVVNILTYISGGFAPDMDWFSDVHEIYDCAGLMKNVLTSE